MEKTDMTMDHSFMPLSYLYFQSSVHFPGTKSEIYTVIQKKLAVHLWS